MAAVGLKQANTKSRDRCMDRQMMQLFQHAYAWDNTFPCLPLHKANTLKCYSRQMATDRWTDRQEVISLCQSV